MQPQAIRLLNTPAQQGSWLAVDQPSAMNNDVVVHALARQKPVERAIEQESHKSEEKPQAFGSNQRGDTHQPSRSSQDYQHGKQTKPANDGEREERGQDGGEVQAFVFDDNKGIHEQEGDGDERGQQNRENQRRHHACLAKAHEQGWQESEQEEAEQHGVLELAWLFAVTHGESDREGNAWRVIDEWPHNFHAFRLSVGNAGVV